MDSWKDKIIVIIYNLIKSVQRVKNYHYDEAWNQSYTINFLAVHILLMLKRDWEQKHHNQYFTTLTTKKILTWFDKLYDFHHPVAPRIHREDLSDQVVRPGQDVKFNVHIDGEPPPTVTWTREGGALPDSARVQDQDYLSKFALVKPTRAQSGKYTITATNPNGTDSVTVMVRNVKKKQFFGVHNIGQIFGLIAEAWA